MNKIQQQIEDSLKFFDKSLAVQNPEDNIEYNDNSLNKTFIKQSQLDLLRIVKEVIEENSHEQDDGEIWINSDVLKDLLIIKNHDNIQ